jgi:uncharacterized membrane protein
VKSATDGTPLASIGITVLTSAGARVVATSTNNQGGYNASVTPGTYSVNATGNGYYSQTKTNVSVSSRQATTVDFSLSPVPVGGGLSVLQYGEISAVIIVAATVVLAVLLTRQKRKKEEEEARINLPPR